MSQLWPPSGRILAWSGLAMVVSFGLLDQVTTLIGIRMIGIWDERNPVLRGLWQIHPILGLAYMVFIVMQDGLVPLTVLLWRRGSHYLWKFPARDWALMTGLIALVFSFDNLFAGIHNLWVFHCDPTIEICS